MTGYPVAASNGASWPNPDEPMYLPRWLEPGIQSDTSPEGAWVRRCLESGAIQFLRHPDEQDPAEVVAMLTEHGYALRLNWDARVAPAVPVESIRRKTFDPDGHP